MTLHRTPITAALKQPRSLKESHHHHGIERLQGPHRMNRRMSLGLPDQSCRIMVTLLTQTRSLHCATPKYINKSSLVRPGFRAKIQASMQNIIARFSGLFAPLFFIL